MSHWARIRSLFSIWSLLGVAIFAVLTVSLRLYILDTSYAIGQTDKMIRALQESRELAEVRLASLRSPRRLEELARTRFKLQRPTSHQVVEIQD